MISPELSFCPLLVLQTSGLTPFSGGLCPHGNFVAQGHLRLELASPAERDGLFLTLTNVSEMSLIVLT